MRLTTFAAWSLLLSAGPVFIPLERAAAQAAPSPEAQPAPAPAAEPAPTPAATPAPAATASTQRNVNLRGGPGTNYALIKLIPAGSPVEVKECKNGWCQAVFQGAEGYIIESSIAPGDAGTAAKPRPTRYVGPPPAYVYPPPPYRYYYYSRYYGPYWVWPRYYYWRRW